jgi:hypothetical protein
MDRKDFVIIALAALRNDSDVDGAIIDAAVDGGYELDDGEIEEITAMARERL